MVDGRLLRFVRLSSLASGCLFLGACGASSPAGISSTSISNTQNPLVAQYNFRSNCAGKAMVEFGPTTAYGRSTSWSQTPGASGGPFSILVAGMRPSTTYHMRSDFNCFGATYSSADQTFTTGALPSSPFPNIQVARPNPQIASIENPGIEEVNMIDASGKSGMQQAFFTDRDGNIIWYYDVGVAEGYFPYTYKLLANGHMLFTISRSITAGVILREVDLAGNLVRQLDSATLAQSMAAKGFDFQPTGFHHDFALLPNGHVVLLANFYKYFNDLPGYPGTTAVLGDGLIDLDENWNPVWAWNSFDHLDVNRHLGGLPDWTHGNAVVYSPEDGNLLLSLRHQSWVLKIDYNNGQGAGDILWKLGYQGDLGPADDPTQWFSFQHYPSIISQDGQQTMLAIWDNGDNRVLDTAGDQCLTNLGQCYSRATVYNVDEGSRSATLLWSDAPGWFSVWGGSINQMPNQNVEFDINAAGGAPFASQVQEVTQTATPQIVWQMTINSLPVYAYRAYRVPSLYPGVNWTY